MNTYYRRDNSIFLKFSDKVIAESIKRQLSGYRFVELTGEWFVPYSMLNKLRVKGILSRFGFVKLPPPTVSPYNKTKQIERFISSLMPFHEMVSEMGWSIQPRPYQNTAIDFMLTRKRVVLGDDMGLGKTLSSIFSVELGGLFPCVVVCPSSVKYHWMNSWQSLNPERKLQVLESGTKLDDSADVHIINYEILGSKAPTKSNKRGYSVQLKFPQLRDNRCIIIDELHFVKNSKSIRTEACRMTARNSEFRFGLTGTMIENSPKELTTPLGIIGVFNELFSSWESFIIKYCNGKRTPFGWDAKGSSNESELNMILRTNIYLRREKSEVMMDLPDYQVTVHDMPLKHRKEYETAKTDILEFLERNGREITDSDQRAQYILLKTTLKRLSIKSKLSGIEQWIKDFLEASDGKLVVFGIHSEPLRYLARKFNGILIDGSLNAPNKAKAIKKFTESDNRIVFGNIQAMGTGTDGLQHVSKVAAFIELPEKPSTYEQAVSRLHRSGQRESVSVNLLISLSTVDTVSWATIQRKMKATEAINKGIDNFETVDFDTMLINQLTNDS